MLNLTALEWDLIEKHPKYIQHPYSRYYLQQHVKIFKVGSLNKKDMAYPYYSSMEYLYAAATGFETPQ